MSLSSSDRVLLGEVLKGVSRSFYLTLAILPQAVRSQIGLAYLFARSADTIADAGELDDAVRVQCLQELKRQLGKEDPEWKKIQTIQPLVITNQSNPDERRLLEKLDECFRLYLGFKPLDRSKIAQVVSVLIGGMEFDLQQFPKSGGQVVRALADVQDLEYYTYAVAGCVGEFWTKMICHHLPGLRGWDQSLMIPLAIRYGKGLQMVNILRDLSEDLQNGRCYIPDVLLKQVSLSPQQLLNPLSAQAFSSVISTINSGSAGSSGPGLAVHDGDSSHGSSFAISLHVAHFNWYSDLASFIDCTRLITPTTSIKIARRDVYGIVAATGLTGGCGSVGTAYWGYWRKRIV